MQPTKHSVINLKKNKLHIKNEKRIKTMRNHIAHDKIKI